MGLLIEIIKLELSYRGRKTVGKNRRIRTFSELEYRLENNL